MEGLIKARGVVKAKITSFQTYITKVLAAYPDPNIQLDEAKRLEIRERIIRIRETYDKYNQIQTDIDILTSDERETVDYCERVEEDYFRLIGQAESLLDRGTKAVNDKYTFECCSGGSSRLANSNTCTNDW